LNELPPDAVSNATDMQSCVSAYESLKEPQVPFSSFGNQYYFLLVRPPFTILLQRSLLGWLLDLIVEVSAFKDINKMGEQNLGVYLLLLKESVDQSSPETFLCTAIVVAPNLYDPPGCDPMEGLVLSQKAVQFLHHLVLHESERKASLSRENRPEQEEAEHAGHHEEGDDEEDDGESDTSASITGTHSQHILEDS